MPLITDENALVHITVTDIENGIYNHVSEFEKNNWDSVSSTVSANSGNWLDAYTTVSSNSGNWDGGTVPPLSTEMWNSNYTTVSSNSGDWSNKTNEKYESVYTTVSSNSGDWETPSLSTEMWNSTYTTVSSNSGNWEKAPDVYTTVSSNSGDWGGGSGGSETIKVVLDCTAQEQTYTLPDITENKTVQIFKKGDGAVAHIIGDIEYLSDGIKTLLNEASVTLVPDNDTYRIESYTGVWYDYGTHFIVDGTINDKFVNNVREFSDAQVWTPLMQLPRADIGTVVDATFNNYKHISRAFDMNNVSWTYESINYGVTKMLPLVNRFFEIGVKSNDINTAIGKWCGILQASRANSFDDELTINVRIEFIDASNFNLVIDAGNDEITNLTKEIRIPLEFNSINNVIIESIPDDVNSVYNVTAYLNGVQILTDTFDYGLFSFNDGTHGYDYCNNFIGDGCDISLGYIQTSDSDVLNVMPKTQKKLIYN